MLTEVFSNEYFNDLFTISDNIIYFGGQDIRTAQIFLVFGESKKRGITQSHGPSKRHTMNNPHRLTDQLFLVSTVTIITSKTVILA